MKLSAGDHEIHKHFLNPEGEYPYDHPTFEGDEDKPEDPYRIGNQYKGDTSGDGKLTYFEAHPEWYGLIDGERRKNVSTWQGVNFCTSNADARMELAKNFVQGLIDGRYRKADIVNFLMIDGGQWCECDNCKKAGNASDKQFSVIVDILDEMEEARLKGKLSREVEIRMSAYVKTIEPPTKDLPE
ncbi:MAG: DUF4838 domain-containing protein, partial [Desulfatiglandales bacterium]